MTWWTSTVGEDVERKLVVHRKILLVYWFLFVLGNYFPFRSIIAFSWAAAVVLLLLLVLDGVLLLLGAVFRFVRIRRSLSGKAGS